MILLKKKKKENIPPLTFQSYNIVIIRRLDLVTKLSARATGLMSSLLRKILVLKKKNLAIRFFILDPY